MVEPVNRENRGNVVGEIDRTEAVVLDDVNVDTSLRCQHGAQPHSFSRDITAPKVGKTFSLGQPEEIGTAPAAWLKDAVFWLSAVGHPVAGDADMPSPNTTSDGIDMPRFSPTLEDQFLNVMDPHRMGKGPPVADISENF